MSVHGPLIFVLLIDKCVESTHVSKPVSTLTVHISSQGRDGWRGARKKKGSFAYHPTSIPSCFASHLKVKHKRDHYTFLGKLPTYPSPKPTLPLTSHLGQNVGLGEG